MTNADWSAARELESAKEGLARAKKRALERARQKRVITQRELRKLVEMRENLEDWRARREEIVEQIVGNLEAEYDFARRCMRYRGSCRCGWRSSDSKLSASAANAARARWKETETGAGLESSSRRRARHKGAIAMRPA